MDEKTLEFLEKEIPEIHAYIDPENDTNTEKTVKKSDALKDLRDQVIDKKNE